MDLNRSGATSRLARAAPWVALLLPPLAWSTFEFGLVAIVRISCTAAGSWIGVAWGVVALVLCGGGFAVGRATARGRDDVASRPWLARLASIAAAIFALAVAFQTLAVLIVPSCAR